MNNQNNNQKRGQTPPVRRVTGNNGPVPVRRAAPAPKPAPESVRPAEPRNTPVQMPPVRRPVRRPVDTPKQDTTDQKTRKIDTQELTRLEKTRPSGNPKRTPDNIKTPDTGVKKDARSPGGKNTPTAPTVKRHSPRTPANRPEALKKDKSEQPEVEKSVGRGIVNNSVKAVLYIVFVLIVSGCLSLFIIFVGNDVFAFVKDSNEITVNIPEGASLQDIAEILEDNGVIKYPTIFKMYINIRKKGADEYLHGDFTVSPSMPYDTLISTFKKSAAARTEITITFTEGMTVDEIIDKFLENNIGTRERFVDVIQNYDFDYWFVDELDKQIAAHPNSGRKYRLEGYLFPDTYNFYSNSTEEAAISRLLDNFNSKFDENYRLTAEQAGMTTDEVVTLASMIQKEAKFNNDYPLVSSVFHNRLDNTDVTGGKLESNATVQYTMPKEDVQLELSLAEIEKYDNAYNTYKYAGLPVGAICNPSLNALYFALYPQDTDYYYFLSDSSGFNLYARTWQEHQANRQKAESGS